jgi:hypothetical protein
MRDEEWQALDEEGLERILVERWLYRGALLAVILTAAMIVTWLGTRGLHGLVDQITVGILATLALTAGAAAFTMRQRDLRILRELRRRRLTRNQ